MTLKFRDITPITKPIFRSHKSTSGQATQQYIQSTTDSTNNKRVIAFSKNIIEKKDIPLPTPGDNVELTNLYGDEGLIKLKMLPQSH